MKFEQLPTGTYFIRYKALAQDGTSSTADTATFDVVPSQASKTEIKFYSLTSPGTLTVGEEGHIDGSIVSSYSPIISVKAETMNDSTGSVVLSAFSSGFSVLTYGPIKNSKVDADSKFSTLPVGSYYVRYTVVAEDGTTASADTPTFQVIAPQREETRITFQSLTTPGDLMVGNGGHIDGYITTSNSPIISVKAEVYDVSSARRVMEAYSGGFSLPAYGPIKNSKIDADLKFGNLPIGSYYITYTVMTEDGTSASANTDVFNVVSAPESGTEITFQSLTTPGNLCVGCGGHIDGHIYATGSLIVSVKAEVINISTNNVVLVAQSSGFTLTSYGPIKGSKIDWDLKFGSLPVGTYYIKYTINEQN